MAKRRTEPAAVAAAPPTSYCQQPKALRAFALMHERWVVFIVTALLDGPLGFNELSRRASGVNPATMKQRLSLLEEDGVITKTVLSTMPPRTEYRLTEAGTRLRVVIDALAQWGNETYPDPAPPAAPAASPSRARRPKAGSGRS